MTAGTASITASQAMGKVVPIGYRSLYRVGVAMNLRLPAAAEEALRNESARSGRSQQELVRAAVERYLGLAEPARTTSELEQLVSSGRVRPPRSVYRRPARRLAMTPGSTSLDLLQREDRI